MNRNAMKTKGTQLAWDQHYAAAGIPAANGPHLFFAGAFVERNDGCGGVVKRRTALTAIIVWEDGSIGEIEQGDPAVRVVA